MQENNLCLRNLCENTLSKLPIYFFFIKKNIQNMLEYWPYAWKQNTFFYKHFFFWRKPGILIPDLYLYNIKIQTDIDQSTVIKLQKNHKFFEIIFEEFFYFIYIYIFLGLDPAGPTWLGWTQQASCEQWNMFNVNNEYHFTVHVNYIWCEQ